MNIVTDRDKIIARHKKYGFFSSPLIEIELYNNKLVLRYENKNGIHNHTHIANPAFSHSRMVVAHFGEATENFKVALQALPIKSFKKALAIINIKEEIADGLTDIEHTVLVESFSATGLVAKINVCYHDKLFELKNI